MEMGEMVSVVEDPFMEPGSWALVTAPDPLDGDALRRWVDFWSEAWGQVAELVLKARWVDLYGPGAACEGMGV
jgi:hypothetical protein